MAKSTTKKLTDRELEVMQIYWGQPGITATDARDLLAKSGADRAYVTVANLVRILVEKGYLEATNDARPYTYKPVRSFEEFSKSFVGELVERVFQGSREQLLVHLLGKQKKLTVKEREFLQQILKEQD